MCDILSSALMILGAAFMLLASIGILRMPDLFMRMQAATKAATLGAGCMLAAVAVHFGELAITSRTLLVTAFVFITAPVAAHLIARAAYSVGTPLWEGTLIDELKIARDSAPSTTDGTPQPEPPPPQEPLSSNP